MTYDFGFTKVKVTRVIFVTNGFHLLFWKLFITKLIFWELFITELLYFTCRLVLVRTWPLLDFGSLGQMSRSQWSHCKKMVYVYYFENYLSQSFHILHADWTWLWLDLYWFWVNKVKDKGHKGPFCKKWFPLIFLRSIYHRAIIFHMLIGLGEDMTLTDFRFTRLKVKFRRIIY